MLARSSAGARKTATLATQASILKDQKHIGCYPASKRFYPGTSENCGTSASLRNSVAAKQKREKDREFLISVLESAVTKRDARAYLQAFAPKPPVGGGKKPPATGFIMYDTIRAVSETPRFIQGPEPEPEPGSDEDPHIVIIKLSEPQSWDDALMDGVAQTITRLRIIGFRSVIIPECPEYVLEQQANRVLKAVGKDGLPAARMVDSAIWKEPASETRPRIPSVCPTNLSVGSGEALVTPLKQGHILVVPPRAFCNETLSYSPAKADDLVVALTSFFSGLQYGFQSAPDEGLSPQNDPHRLRRALVDRIIVIDPHGGIPSRQEGEGARVFINLEEQFNAIQDDLKADLRLEQPDPTNSVSSAAARTRHLDNLRLAKATLAILPSTASCLITSPAEAANIDNSKVETNGSGTVGQFAGEVRTRRFQHPIIHNLITDRPIYSPSLPIGRLKRNTEENKGLITSWMPTTTLAKKGMPLTIFPDPRRTGWQAPTPGGPRLKLTDTCIDLPRLLHLINDSFSRELNPEHYLRRLENSLAGIIIAGEYEGGAILTWERPFGLDEETAYNTGRLVPYLDKFAVLKKWQGAGGVADIVFNAMVRECFPYGVCWRSRKDNPVNKWYFERSCGARKLSDSNWTMFWTSPSAPLHEQVMDDYEDVCRNVTPSWRDNRNVME
ncbi:mitochondrial amino-acid acetyltransferase [Naviculisporaceae sp. PSN 640]